MHEADVERRRFLMKMSALGVAAAPALAAMGCATGPVKYDPQARRELAIHEVEFRRAPSGRVLMARVYQPRGSGPFPTLLDLHGGAWNRKDRFANEPMDRAVAASGVLVVAVDLTVAPEAPYPAAVQDANYAVRWLKWRAPGWNGDPATLGVLGSSSGGHIAELLALRPRDARYNAIALPQAPRLDAQVAYVATRSPISDPAARLEQAQRMQRERLIRSTHTFFNPPATLDEASPQAILDRREPVSLPPLLILQGALDDNVLPSVQRRFAQSYRAAGGECELHVFEGCEHEWVAKPGPQTDRAHALVREFIARHYLRLRARA